MGRILDVLDKDLHRHLSGRQPAAMSPMLGGCVAKADPEVALFGMACCAYTKDEKKEKCESTEATACVARCTVCLKFDGVELDAYGGKCDDCQSCMPYIGCILPTAPDEVNAGMALAAAPA